MAWEEERNSHKPSSLFFAYMHVFHMKRSILQRLNLSFIKSFQRTFFFHSFASHIFFPLPQKPKVRAHERTIEAAH